MRTQRSPAPEGGIGLGGVPGARAVPEQPREKRSHLLGPWKHHQHSSCASLVLDVLTNSKSDSAATKQRAGAKKEPSRDQYSLNPAVCPQSPLF